MDGIGKYQQKLFCENNKITPRSILKHIQNHVYILYMTTATFTANNNNNIIIIIAIIIITPTLFLL